MIYSHKKALIRLVIFISISLFINSSWSWSKLFIFIVGLKAYSTIPEFITHRLNTIICYLF